MTAFSVPALYDQKPNAFLSASRQRFMIALGLKDARHDTYDGEDKVNNGYESDAYWAGRMMAPSFSPVRLP